MRAQWCSVGGERSDRLIDEGSGPPLIVFHGWNGSNHNVLRWLPALTPRFRVIVPDLPGCNGVPALPTTHTAAAYAEWAEGFMDGMNLSSARIGGGGFLGSPRPPPAPPHTPPVAR